MYYDHKGRPNQPGITDELIKAQGTGRKRRRAEAAAQRSGDKRSHLQKSREGNRLARKKFWDINDGKDYSYADPSWLKVHHPKGKNFGKVKAVRHG